METPKVNWVETEKGGNLIANVEGIDVSVLKMGIKWEWMVYWHHETLGCFGYISYGQTRDIAQAECEYALSRELKARQWDAQKAVQP